MTRSALETPMMRQFLAIKAEHPDAIVFYRMGDFYEMFLRDAEVAASELDITLTTRDRGKADAVPMCGIPVHSADGYVQRLVDRGHRVAICEQVEDPKSVGRRLVKREVIEVVTPGLVGDPEGVDAVREVRLAALASFPDQEVGLATLEATTGDFRVTAHATQADTPVPELLWQELQRIAPRELLVWEGLPSAFLDRIRQVLPELSITPLPEEKFDPGATPARPDGFDPALATAEIRAASAILVYLGSHQPFALRHTVRLRRYRLDETMVLDAATRRHLELFENGEDRGRRGTLIGCIDETVTPLGARRLARWLSYPQLDPEEIAARQDAVSHLADRDRPRRRFREAARPVRDLERILAKAARPGATPRDLAALRASLEALPGVNRALDGESGETDGSEAPEGAREVAELAWIPGAEATRPEGIRLPEPLTDVAELLREALVEDPPAIPRGSRGAHETGYIQVGFRSELDGLRESAAKGREWIVGLEREERERTGIPNLKVRFHPVHGYSLEISKAHLERVPSDYERKQTLANAERFTTAGLREVEARVLGANDRAAALERELFESVRQAALAHGARIRRAADAVAELDALASLAEIARRKGWVRPIVDDGAVLEIRAGRHPVVEALERERGGDEFVPNDTDLDPATTQILILTGPNMSGKSTYLRQVALITLLAQIGSFVPAESARIGVVDRVFTRVGASDRLARGESTFMVEMRETAEILSQASPRSLIILDEIGRGTSTFDGLSIAWAVVEYLHDTPALGARTLFATHYHELTELSLTRPRVANGHFEAREWGEEVLFLRRLAPGGASRSYGIQVARLAGLPERVVHRAREVLENLEGGELLDDGRPRLASGEDEPVTVTDQLTLFAPAPSLAPEAREVLAELSDLDPDGMTPMEALVALERMVRLLHKGESR